MVKNDLDVYFIAGSQDVKNGDLLPVLENALQAGITMFQFREKGRIVSYIILK
jgi:Thiamine monophosphate synthase